MRECSASGYIRGSGDRAGTSNATAPVAEMFPAASSSAPPTWNSAANPPVSRSLAVRGVAAVAEPLGRADRHELLMHSDRAFFEWEQIAGRRR
jgi:hypothetical protein